MSTIKGPIQLKGKTAAELTAENPVLLDRQLCFETDTATEVDNVRYLKVKQGPGAWNDLKYVQIGVPVQGFSGDYNDLENKPTIPVAGDFVSKVSVQRNATALTNSGPNVVWNAAENGYARHTLAGNRTIAAPSNAVNGNFYTIDLTQDATGGRIVLWNAVFKFPSFEASTVKYVPGTTTRFTFRFDGTNFNYVAGGFGDATLLQGRLNVKVGEFSDTGYSSFLTESENGIEDENISKSLKLAGDESGMSIRYGDTFNFNELKFEEQDGDNQTVVIPDKSGTIAVVDVGDNYADDASASAAGIKVGHFYHSNGIVKMRIL